MIKLVESSSREYDPFKGLKKVKASEIPEGSLIGTGLVTDGRGNCYEIPKKGYSSIIRIDKGVTARYNFSESTIEIMYNNEIYESEGLDAENFFDNPEYWANKAYQECEDELTGVRNSYNE